MIRKGKGKKKKGGLSKEAVREKIITILSKSPQQGFNYKQIAKRLDINDQSEKQMISEILRELAKKGTVKEIYQGKYIARASRGHITGTVDMTRMGYGFVVSDDMEEDVFVAARNLRTALHGDKVKVWLYARKKGSRPEGEVVEIIERWRTSFVGTVEIMPNFAFLIPDNKNMPFDLFIPSSKLNGAKQGQKAVARVIEWDSKSKNPVAEIIKVLGEPGLHETEMHAILAEFELPYEFTADVKKDAEKIPVAITDNDIKSRRDFRNVPTFTIDPVDARDFDDAISLRQLDNGNREVGIHIADVTHYIKSGLLIEKEAKQRATSVYLVDNAA